MIFTSRLVLYCVLLIVFCDLGCGRHIAYPAALYIFVFLVQQECLHTLCGYGQFQVQGPLDTAYVLFLLIPTVVLGEQCCGSQPAKGL